MIIKSSKFVVKEKTNEKRTSTKTEKEYIDNMLFLQAEDGLMYTMHFCSDYIYNKAEKGKQYILKYYLDTNAKLILNDIEESK